MAILPLAPLTPDAVDVWIVELDVENAMETGLEALLSADERERANRFRFAQLRRSFVIARGVLRRLLGSYLGVSPEVLHFEYGHKGKPYLSDFSEIAFNTSHSGDLAAYAFSRTGALGVDVEKMRTLTDLDAIAQRFFSAGETRDLLGLDAEERQRAFFRCWTRKEAYLKAVGDGLSAPLDNFQVTLRGGEPARFLQIGGDAAEAGKWMLHHLTPASGYAGALAYRGEARQVRERELLKAGALLRSLEPIGDSEMGRQ